MPKNPLANLVLLLSASAAITLSFTPQAYALKLRPHPIDDLIEGDERTPPSGKYIVEERPATPPYRLPSMNKFPQSTAVETLPVGESPAKGQDVSKTAGDVWDKWSSWDEWKDLEDWDSWEKEGSGEESSGDDSFWSEEDSETGTGDVGSAQHSETTARKTSMTSSSDEPTL